MSNEEMRALDAWIAEHVMGWTVSFHAGNITLWLPTRTSTPRTFNATTDAADAMEVLRRCVLKVGENDSVEINQVEGNSGFGWCAARANGLTPYGEGATLELAICLFAKQLFSK
jgi:hypothetical protein